MSDYVISCCSTVDLPKKILDDRGIPFVQFSYFVDGVEKKDDLYETITPHEFYKMIEDGAETSTAQISPVSYEEHWRPFLESGKDVLHLTLSSGISGTVQSARIAKGIAEEKYPGRRVEVVDSLSASSGFGLLVIDAKERADSGISLDENLKWIENNKRKLNHWFFSTDLSSYIRGGRVSKVSGFFGNMLNICPLLNVNSEGKLIPREKIRTKKKVIKRIFEMMKEHAEDKENYSKKVYISHSDCYEDARAVADLVEEYFKNMEGKVLINDIGTVIGSHTGPGTVALFFWGDERTI